KKRNPHLKSTDGTSSSVLGIVTMATHPSSAELPSNGPLEDTDGKFETPDPKFRVFVENYMEKSLLASLAKIIKRASVL
ncbi:hypothetical protein CEXT_40271, partial [Caerostris extrusa]